MHLERVRKSLEAIRDDRGGTMKTPHTRATKKRAARVSAPVARVRLHTEEPTFQDAAHYMEARAPEQSERVVTTMWPPEETRAALTPLWTERFKKPEGKTV